MVWDAERKRAKSTKKERADPAFGSKAAEAERIYKAIEKIAKVSMATGNYDNK